MVSASFGAHFNPAITFAAVLLGIITQLIGLGFVIFQIAAVVVASLTLMLVLSQNNSALDQIVVTKGYYVTYYKSFNVETIYTFIFIMIVYMVAWTAVEFPFELTIEYLKIAQLGTDETHEELALIPKMKLNHNRDQ